MGSGTFRDRRKRSKLKHHCDLPIPIQGWGVTRKVIRGRHRIHRSAEPPTSLSAPPFPSGRPSSFRATVHGTVFAGRDQHLAHMSRGDRLHLIPDPPLLEDPDVWVHLETGEPIGHLPPEIGAWLAPWLLQGGGARARVVRVKGSDTPSWLRLLVEVSCRTREEEGRTAGE